MPELKRSYLVANSETVASRIRMYNGITPNAIINPGCDIIQQVLPRGDSEGKSALYSIPAGQYILSFSRLSVIQKGINLIIETARRMPNQKFVIAGSNDAELKDIQIELLPPNLQLLALEFTEDEKSYLFVNCTVFLAPYVAEDFGITPLEANSCGKPVVFCEDGGEILRTQKHLKTGFKTQRNAIDMAGAIEYCIEHRESMKEDCIKNALQYSWDKFESSFLDIVVRMLSDKK